MGQTLLEKHGIGILNVECVVLPSVSKVAAITVTAEAEYLISNDFSVVIK